jgi:hypothetical protein
MGGWSDGVATAFQQVEGGYLFQLNPWLFGRSHGYLVDEATSGVTLSEDSPMPWFGSCSRYESRHHR